MFLFSMDLWSESVIRLAENQPNYVLVIFRSCRSFASVTGPAGQSRITLHLQRLAFRISKDFIGSRFRKCKTMSQWIWEVFEIVIVKFRHFKWCISTVHLLVRVTVIRKHQCMTTARHLSAAD
jgi:hypothetical protein